MKRLLRFAELHDDETLDSYVERLAVANYYEPTIIIRKLILGGIRDRAYLRPRYLKTFTSLSQLTAIPEITLHAATAHGFADVLTPPDIEIEQFASGLAKFTYAIGLRTHRDYQYCPRCLAENPYHRLIWLPTAVSACLEHQCLLVAGCPHCHEKLRINAIVADECASCGGRLSHAEAVDLSTDALGLTAQQLIQHWLGFAEMPAVELPIATPRTMYRFIDGVRYVLSQVGRHWPHLHKLSGIYLLRFNVQNNRMSPLESYIAYTTAFKALADWPHGFYAFLDAYRTRESLNGNFQREMKVLYHWLQRQWQGEGFDFVQHAFDDYIIDHYRDSFSIMQSERYLQSPALAERFYYIPIAEAARQLDTRTAVIHQLASIGILRKHETERLLVVRADVQQLQEECATGIAIEDVADRAENYHRTDAT